MTTKRSETGKLGEDKACEYLKKNGYKIIERNHRNKMGEIDAIAIDKDKTLVFIEVKTIRNSGNQEMMPEDNLNSRKIGILSKVCDQYANSSPHLIHSEKGWRIDLLALTIEEENVVMEHYKNIAP